MNDKTITQEIADFIATEGNGVCWDALNVALARLKAAQARIEQLERELEAIAWNDYMASIMADTGG